MKARSSSAHWNFVQTGSKLKKCLTKLIETSSLIAIDVETTGLNPFKDQLLLVQVGTRTEQLVIDVEAVGSDIRVLAPVLAHPSIGKLGHNLMFDIAFLEANGLKVRGPIIDTYLGSKVLTAGLPEVKGLNSLSGCVKRMLGKRMEEKEELQKSFIGHTGPFREDQKEYAANDVGPLIFDLHDAMQSICKDANLSHVWEMECRALLPITAMYINGFKLNTSYYKELLKSELEFKQGKKQEVIEHLNHHGVLEEYKCPLSGELLVHPRYSGRGSSKTKGFNLDSPTQLGIALAMLGVPLDKKVNEDTGKVTYSCDKGVLAFYIADFEILRLYKDYKEAAVACQYIEKLIGFAESYPNNRIHARYNQLVRTGRMSCTDPNLQQIKKGKKYRSGFIAEKGNLLAIADYSQLEIRLVTEVSRDKNLLNIYRQELDVHTASAALMTSKKMEDVTKDERQAAKVFNFACLYGAGARTVRKQAVSMFGLMWSLDEVQEKLAQWKSAYPDVIRWQRNQGNQEDLEVFTLFGRRRLLQAPRRDKKTGLLQSNFTTNLNTPVQGLGADCLKAALALLWERHLADDPQVKIVACVHDEIILETPEDRVEEAKQWLKTCMEDAAPMVGITHVPIVADPSHGPDWSDK